MNKKELNQEICRVKTAIEKTESKYLRKDYEKYLKKLLKQRKYLKA